MRIPSLLHNFTQTKACSSFLGRTSPFHQGVQGRLWPLNGKSEKTEGSKLTNTVYLYFEMQKEQQTKVVTGYSVDHTAYQFRVTMKSRIEDDDLAACCRSWCYDRQLLILIL
uniref:Uncharacterized protein n=1 Tax=Oryza brachyantha TaxID=4533 RepID=J3LBE2_ORYBR